MKTFWQCSPEKKLAKKIIQFEFKGQHSGAGFLGFASCAAVVTEFIGQIFMMRNDEFFRLFPHPDELKKKDLKVSSEILSCIVSAGNRIHLESAKIIAVEKRGAQKQSQASPVKRYRKFLQGKSFPRCIYKISHSLSGYEHIKQLVIIEEKNCDKNDITRFVKETYLRFNKFALDENDIMFVCGAAIHFTCFFIKTRGDEKFYYLFDSAPARAIGGSNAIGTMEIHKSFESLIESVKLRWKTFFLNSKAGELYAVTTLNRIYHAPAPAKKGA